MAPTFIVVYFTILGLSLQSDGEIEYCDQFITDEAIRSLYLPEALSLPLGKSFLAKKYGIVFFVNISYSTLAKGDHTYPRTIDVNICSISNEVVSKFLLTKVHTAACNVTLWGRLVGVEILPFAQITRKHSRRNICSWEFLLPINAAYGDYYVEIMTIWTNAMIDPDLARRGNHTLNNGFTVHLGGIGTVRNRSGEIPNKSDIRLNDGDPERSYSHVYGSPFYLHRFGQLSYSHSPPLSHRCTSGNMTGRWVYEPYCEKFNRSYSDIPTGHECWQTDETYQGHNVVVPVRSRREYMVWRPYNCTLNSYAHSPNSTAPSEAARCLTDAGVGLIAGFGDSIGIEQEDHFKALVGGIIWSNTSAPFPSHLRGFLVCNSWRHNLHWIDEREKLRNCIARSVQERLIRTHSRLRTVVLITNFNIHHGQWKFSLDEVKFHMTAQMLTYKKLRIDLARNGFRLRLIWFSGVAIHGYRVPGLTFDRQVYINKLAQSILVEAGGWEVLDAYNMTLARSDGTRDGVHYRGGVSKGISLVLMNMLCNS